MTDELTPKISPDVVTVTQVMFEQIMNVMGQKRPNWFTRILFRLLSRPVGKMAKMLVEFDQNIAQKGFSQAGKEFLRYFVDEVELRGTEHIPKDGALLIMCNHPAAYDVFILIASIGRDDLKVLGSDIQLVRQFPNIQNHFIPVPYDIAARLQTIRASIRHLKSGGVLLIFPRGDVEPDPAVSPGAYESLGRWSASLELFLRQVPQTISIITIASGILSAKWFKNPLFRLWKKYEQRQKVTEIFQVATQLITGKKPASVPLVTFSPPLTVTELGGEAAEQGVLLASLIEQGRQLLADHPRS